MAQLARSQSTDPFSSNRFHVVDTDGFLGVAGGFNSVTFPSMNIEVVEYSEGLWTYARKYAGRPTFDDVTMTKGVVKSDSSFYKWIRAAAENKQYRSNLIIKHFHRDDVTGMIDYKDAKPYRELHCFNVIPITIKPGSDFDSMSSEISIEEITLSIEFFRLFVNGNEVTAV